jgi:hypothetical protein
MIRQAHHKPKTRASPLRPASQTTLVSIKCFAPGLGFEPRLPGPEPGVLPLDDPGAKHSTSTMKGQAKRAGEPGVLPLDDPGTLQW